MFRNYLKTALRNLKRNKSYAFINVLGLAVGIAASLLIFMVVRFETSYDDFHSKRNNIYRVGSIYSTQDGEDYSGGSSFPVGPALKLDFPQLKQVARIFSSGDDQVTIPGENNNPPQKFQSDFYYAEPEFFSIFDFEFLSGDAKSTLTSPNSVVLTEETAEKFFGNWKNAIGKTIQRNNDKDEILKVSGILKNIPANSDFPLGIVASYSSLQHLNVRNNMNDWISTWSGSNTYVVVPDGMSIDKFNHELKAFAKKHKPSEYQKDSYIAQPLSTIHSDDRFGNFGTHIFSEGLVKALRFIALFLILIACVNFINLATAQAVNRSKEVGVRKVLGGNKGQLAFQFLSETAMITLTALLVAAGIAALALPLVNNLLEIKMTFDIWRIDMLLFIACVAIAVTILSGLYPAMILSRFNPITALKSKVSAKMMGGLSLRRGLVIIQFAIAHILIIGMLIVVSQMNYFRNASLGFDKAAIVNVNIPGDSLSHLKLNYLRDRLQQNPDIQSLSFSFSSPSADGNWNSDFKFDHSTKSTNFSANLKWADVDYFKTYNLQFLAGRPYTESDTVKEFVVNETLLRKLGINDPKDAIGKELNFWDGRTVAQIVGVIKDFNSYSLREPMAPVVLGTWKDVYQTLNVKIRPGKERAVVASVEKLWNEAFPDYVFQYSFLDDTIKDFYRQENQLAQLYKIFACIAIFISCLGLYGLVSFMAVQRTKEVGIRKVLGASAKNIVYLLSKEFTLLIIIAFAVAAPVAWYIMTGWLENYTYRISLGVTIFLMAIAASVVIAWLTVGHRAIKAATANPVKSLRTE
jgi:putative ABC transport system permease protein